MTKAISIYDPDPIYPVAKIKENLGIWLSGRFEFFSIEFIEPIPRSSPLVVDMVAIAAVANIAANGTLAQRAIPALLMNANELVHLRWEPIDDVEGVLWEVSGQARFMTGRQGTIARVTKFTSLRDPYLATTTFFIYGKDRDMNLEVRNPNGVVVTTARFAFWGFKYLLSPLTRTPSQATYLPAEGRANI